MLLVHQTGSVKVGEIIRYTLTYDPAADRVIPSPQFLHLKIKNASSIPLRAAYLHGPFALHVAAYPSSFEPNSKLENPRKDGVPQFEPNLKAGSTFSARLTIPDDLRIKTPQHAHHVQPGKKKKTVTWIIEVTSQIIFSNSASVKFELSIGRDEKSLDFNFNAVPKSPTSSDDRKASFSSHTKGVYSKAVTLDIADTEKLWDTPALPTWEKPQPHGKSSSDSARKRNSVQENPRPKNGKKQKIHLVVLTHGLHSNLGADMLYLKESIDATAKRTRENRTKKSEEKQDTSIAPLSGGQESLSDADLKDGKGVDDDDDDDDDDNDDNDNDDEQVIVRGFPGNAVKTENGIKYLGKRLARYIMDFTYPDQPNQFAKKQSLSERITRSMSFRPGKESDQERDEGIPAHEGSKITNKPTKKDQLAYTFTSISFVGHSLGGLVQLYAVAYIQKHAPGFFDNIKPINFIAMATPFLGLSNENPVYVKFALDFGLVGRTGKDLGLAWRAPTIARSGWSAMVGGFGSSKDNGDFEQQPDPRTKPLLRILPTGPAHIVLRKFRNRTVYSNVVNDGIVPLRTGCLLFLDWRGLGKVENVRRENGLVGTFVEWGWAEVTGQNSVSGRHHHPPEYPADNEENDSTTDNISQSTVPQPAKNVVNEEDEHFLKSEKSLEEVPKSSKDGALESILSFLRPTAKTTKNDLKMFSRSQTVSMESEASDPGERTPSPDRGRQIRTLATPGGEPSDTHSPAPPKTTIFESALDILSPPSVPSIAWLIDPSNRARTIFHDRIYHPEDIPEPLPSIKRVASKLSRINSSSSIQTISTEDETKKDSVNGMRVEEKIARAYHKDLSWRKVLVSLEPDAHNNMLVRRMFANAYGWPVIKHLCDTHFGDTFSARTRDEDEPANDRAKDFNEPVPKTGERVRGQESQNAPKDIPQEFQRQATGELETLQKKGSNNLIQNLQRESSLVGVDDSYLDTSDEEEPDQRSTFQRLWSSPASKSPNSESRERKRSKSPAMPVKSGPAPAILSTSDDRSSPSGLSTISSIAQGAFSTSFSGMSELGLRKSVPEMIASSSQPQSPSTTTTTKTTKTTDLSDTTDKQKQA